MSQANTKQDKHLPDWESLSEFNFLLYRRTVDGLNAALSALEVASVPGGSGLPPEWWYNRSKDKIEAVLNLSMAWSWLIQFKNGVALTEQVMRPFFLQEMLDWLTINLQLRRPLVFDDETRTLGNKQSIQEAILLLHSVGTTIGRVSLVIEPSEAQIVVKVQVSRVRSTEPITSIDALIDSYGQHWRERSIAFELRTARDFLQMNQLDLKLTDNGSMVNLWFALEQVVSTSSKRSVKHLLADVNKEKNPPPTLKLHHPNQWHLPAISHRIDPLQLQKPANKIIQPVPPSPKRAGGWHKPFRRIQSVTNHHETPPLSPELLHHTTEFADETLNTKRTEIEESGGQDLYDRPNLKGTAHDV